MTKMMDCQFRGPFWLLGTHKLLHNGFSIFKTNFSVSKLLFSNFFIAQNVKLVVLSYPESIK